jgi:hypothetical protein
MVLDNAMEVAEPEHKVCEVGVAVATGKGLTVTVTCWVSTAHDPGPVEVTEYVVVLAGEAVTVAVEVELSPVAGVQVYPPVPPDAVRFTLLPAQIVGAEGVMVMPANPPIASTT